MNHIVEMGLQPPGEPALAALRRLGLRTGDGVEDAAERGEGIETGRQRLVDMAGLGPQPSSLLGEVEELVGDLTALRVQDARLLLEGRVERFIDSGERGEPVKVKVEPTVVEGAFTPDRGFNLMPISKTRVADSFGQQVQYGWDETVDALLMVYRFLQKLGTQVPLTALGGPITIARAAGMHASEGLAQLLIFLTMLSANLAVINFLPIPLLDGGHMVFLLWEGLRGRPAGEKFVMAMHTAGFVFIITLMLFVLSLDFGLIPRNL